MAPTDSSENPPSMQALRIGSPPSALRNPQLNLLASGVGSRRNDRSGPLSPVLSDSTSWGIGPSLTRTISANSATSGTIDRSIWQNEPQSRLGRVSEIKKGPDPMQAGSGRGPSTGDNSIPFHIPLNPNPKSYRSQSYSVGQLDSASNADPSGRFSFNRGNYNTRSRPGRVGALGEHESPSLHHLREDEDTSDWLYDQKTESPQNVRPHFETRLHNVGGGYLGQPGSLRAENSQARKESSSYYVQEDVVEDAEDISISASQSGPQDWLVSSHNQRSDQHDPEARQMPLSPAFKDSQDLLAKKAHWQSDYDFAAIPEMPQSRRHSFATVPSRGLAVRYLESPPIELRLGQKESSSLILEPHGSRIGPPTGQFPYTNDKRDDMLHRSIPHSVNQRSFMPAIYDASPHAITRLYLVTFKVGRAEFYYVPEALGLDISVGDTVIVDADRGTDLGTVVQDDVQWEDVPVLRAKWEREHFRCLMMFSRRYNTEKSGDLGSVEHASRTAALSNTISPAVNAHARADGAMTDLKPKMIKRLALQAEMHSLKEKEANEAKAKRTCQAKADEHHLEMEILDAEYQMDWKKLTFYYYAETYVNFNSLVTDLFKVYKTRIWMSAVNPASYVTPSSMLQQPAEHGDARSAGLPVGLRNGTARMVTEQQHFNGGNAPTWPYTMRTSMADQFWPPDNVQYGAAAWPSLTIQDQRQQYTYGPYISSPAYDQQVSEPMSHRFVSDMDRLSLNPGSMRRG